MSSSSIKRAFRAFFLMGTLASAAGLSVGCDQPTQTTPSNAYTAPNGKEPPLPATSEAPPIGAQPPPRAVATVPFAAVKPTAFASATKTTTVCAIDLVGDAAA